MRELNCYATGPAPISLFLKQYVMQNSTVNKIFSEKYPSYPCHQPSIFFSQRYPVTTFLISLPDYSEHTSMSMSICISLHFYIYSYYIILNKNGSILYTFLILVFLLTISWRFLYISIWRAIALPHSFLTAI